MTMYQKLEARHDKYTLLIDHMTNLPCQAVVHTYGDVVVKVESEESLDLDKNEKVPIDHPPAAFLFEKQIHRPLQNKVHQKNIIPF